MKKETYYGDKPCTGCVYWKAFGGRENAARYCCCYALVERHTRGCEPGERCVVRKEKDKKAANTHQRTD